MTGRRDSFIRRRRAAGFSQEGLAERLQVDRTTVARWERGKAEPQPYTRARLAEALGTSVDQLDALLAGEPENRSLDIDDRGGTVTSGDDNGGDLTDRRAFTINAALAGLGIASPLRDWVTAPDVPQHLSMEHLQQVSATIASLERADAAAGGGSLCDVAIAMHRRLTRWEREATYPRQVGDALQSNLGDLEAWIGWLALDAERRAESRRYLQEAIVRARLRDDPHLEVQVLAIMAMLVRDARPVESVQIAEAALRISAPWATPRLTSLLHLRTTHASALMGDAVEFNRALARAKTALDRGPSDDDPPYTWHVGEREVNGAEGLSHLALGRPDRAISCLQARVAHHDPVYRRNQILGKVSLAIALHQQGDSTAAGTVALDALPEIADLKSGRGRKRLAGLRADLGQVADQVPAARDFVEAYDVAKMAA
ncbi:helix-turn-helix transcriptional regulator [Solwaraspora sp. WMMA2056]|uniref:helix-turn-helix transcriptional regulator n=1 Tax=Solwaraspora sp. WMMA2056 TaxID=3015161 RepID=UPI00259B4C47|nr:helix-turn-helix transcriptional regulator [Solwaraspora sp. WMMA2056]WJK43268.1 helix-turn-helix transcriptional regulator [Solwaraspora sp. WMMA2056]